MAKDKPKAKRVKKEGPRRVVTMRIREVTTSDGTVLTGYEIVDFFKKAWQLSTNLANWCQRELAVYDPGRRLPGMEKMPPVSSKLFPKSSNYPEGRDLYQWALARFPGVTAFEGAKKSMSGVMQAVWAGWISADGPSCRYKVLWTNEASACVFRWPYPWPVNSQSIKLLKNDRDQPMVSIEVPGGRATVRLEVSKEYRRQLREFDYLFKNPDRVCAAKVIALREQGKITGVKLGLVGRFEKVVRTDATKICCIYTDPNALLVVAVDGRSVTITNGDHITRALKVIKETHRRHKVWLQRISEDRKRETRMDRRQRANTDQEIQRRCEKQANRIKTAIQQIAVQVAQFCERQHVGTIFYCDNDQSFIPEGFAWFALKERIAAIFTGKMGGQFNPIKDKDFHKKSPQEIYEWLDQIPATTTAETIAATSRVGRKATAQLNRQQARTSHPAVSPYPAKRTSSGNAKP